MSGDPPDAPPDPPLAGQTPEEPPRGRSAGSMVLGIVAGLAAVLGVWTLLVAGICVSLAGQIGG
jgi:hypothetical protein